MECHEDGECHEVWSFEECDGAGTCWQKCPEDPNAPYVCFTDCNTGTVGECVDVWSAMECNNDGSCWQSCPQDPVNPANAGDAAFVCWTDCDPNDATIPCWDVWSYPVCDDTIANGPCW